MIPILRDHDPLKPVGEIDNHGRFRIYDAESITFEDFAAAFPSAGVQMQEWREQDGKRYVVSGFFVEFSVGLMNPQPHTPDVLLSNGAMVCHRMLGRSVQQTFVVRNPGGQMTPKEWDEYNKIVAARAARAQ